jgi:hypothetical protein
MSHDTSFLSTEKLSIQSPTPHNFATVDFTIKLNNVSLPIDVNDLKLM